VNARRRALSAVLVVAMGGAVALPLMVAGAANADNGLDLIAPSGTGTYSGNSYSFSGTADAVDTSDIVVHDGPLATDPVLCTVAYSANWDCDSGWTPSPGSFTLSSPPSTCSCRCRPSTAR
jgi:hypothetical protein